MESLMLEIQELVERHKKVWRNEDDWFWLAGLLEEVAELGNVLAGKHADTIEWELKQIAAICINWLEMCYERKPQKQKKASE